MLKMSINYYSIYSSIFIYLCLHFRILNECFSTYNQSILIEIHSSIYLIYCSSKINLSPNFYIFLLHIPSHSKFFIPLPILLVSMSIISILLSQMDHKKYLHLLHNPLDLTISTKGINPTYSTSTFFILFYIYYFFIFYILYRYEKNINCWKREGLVLIIL